MARKHRQHIEPERHAEHQRPRQKQGFFSRPADLERWGLVSLTVVLLLIPLILAVSFRMGTFSLPITDQWAQSSVENAIKGAITQQVRQQYPTLPAQNLQGFVDTEYQKYLAQNPDALKQQIAQTSAYFRSQMQDERNHTYMPDIDTYYWLLKIENILKNGFPGDTRVGDVVCDTHMLAPIGGCDVGRDFYTEFTAWSYKISSRFTETTPMYIFFWMPVIFGALCVIPAFFIGRRQGLLVAFIVAMLIAVHPSVLGRTGAGFADTDILVVFFPLLVAWFFLEAFEAKTWTSRIVYILLTGIGFGLFAWSWGNWWFVFDIFIVVLVGYLVYEAVRILIAQRKFDPLHSAKALLSEKEFLSTLAVFGGFVLASLLFVTLFTGISTAHAPLDVFSTTSGLKAAVRGDSIWPNTYTTVAELNEPDISGIIGSVGGKFVFVVALLGMVFTLLPRDRLSWKDWGLLVFSLIVFLFLVSAKGLALPIFWFIVVMAIPVAAGGLLRLFDDQGIDVKYAFLLIAWLAASVFTMTKGVRFILLLIPPFAIAFAIAVGAVYMLLKEWLTHGLEFDSRWVSPALFILLCLVLVTPVTQGYAAGQQQTPIMNDAWYNTLTKINQESAPDAIINSWWDFGHWFKEVADRRVTFDGITQVTPMAHWVGRALLTSDEKETMAILRMLDCGSYLGVDDLQERLPSKDQYEAIMLTKKTIMMHHADAKTLLEQKGLSSGDADYVLNHTHCDPPENYFITSGDMVGKAGVWAHFGAWSFERADAYQHFRSLPSAEAIAGMQAKYNWSEETAQTTYWDMQKQMTDAELNSWISPWPGYPGGGWTGCSYTQNGTLFVCPMRMGIGTQQGQTTVLENVVINLTEPNASHLEIGFYNAQQQRIGTNNEVQPGAIVLVKNSTFTRIDFSGNTFGYAFVADLDSPRVLLADQALSQSTFTKLFYLDGKGTKAFRLFSDQQAFSGDRITVWTIDWSKLKELGLE